MPTPYERKCRETFDLSHSTQTTSVPLSTVFELQLPFYVYLETSPGLEKERIYTTAPPVTDDARTTTKGGLQRGELFVDSFNLKILISLGGEE